MVDESEDGVGHLNIRTAAGVEAELVQLWGFGSAQTRGRVFARPFKVRVA